MLILAGGTYVAYTMNMLGPMMQMANAAGTQGVEIGKQKLREFIENSDGARKALNMPVQAGGSSDADADAVSLDTLDSQGKKKTKSEQDDEI